MSELRLGLWHRPRVRLVRQAEITECGLAALAMVAHYHGLDTDLATLRRRFQLSLRGASLRSLIDMADQLGFATRAVKLPLERLGELNLPAILHWNMNHAVVLERVRGGKALIHDPESRSRWMRLDEVSDHFTGVALELRPTDSFRPSDERERLKLTQLWRRVVGLKRALVQTLVLSLVLEAFVLISPYYMQIALDDVVPALDNNLLTILAAGFALFAILNTVASMLRSFVLLSAGTALGFGMSVNVARRLFRLPISWFEKRQVGDILSRFQSVAPIRSLLTEGAVASALDGALAVLTLSVMFFYSVPLTALALVAFGLYLIVRLISFAMQRSAQEEVIVTSGKEQSILIETLRGITTLRLFNRESSRLALWQSRYTDSTNASVSLSRVGIFQSVSGNFIFGLEGIISIYLAIGAVIAGGFSIGMVFAFMAYKALFLQRAASLVNQGIELRMLGLHLERLSDIALADEDIGFAATERGGREFSGSIAVRDLAFRYGPTDPLILEKASLAVEAGEHVAITGPSGGGKSTLVKILLGLLEPEEGELLVDGVPLAQFGHRNFREQIAAVLQEDHLFAGSLADNIALFDDDPDRDRIVAAAQAAALHEDIVAMPMGYETMVGDMGSALSGGQKQRVLLARALYRRPRLLIMDEGTSHLDAHREQLVNAAIANMGITRIIIAHRIETILAAQKIYTINGKAIVDVTDSYRDVRFHLANAPRKLV